MQFLPFLITGRPPEPHIEPCLELCGGRATPSRFHLADAEGFAGIFSINIVATAVGFGIR
jgi:hypothetical protein